MKQLIIFIAIILALIVIVKVFDIDFGGGNSIATSTPIFDQSISDSVITVIYPGTHFGLATNPTQILAKSYIPPCDENFNYCFYYIGEEYKGTNFESAGLRVQKRINSNENLCLTAPPEGYDTTFVPNATTSQNAYSSSVFSTIGNAGAGHYAEGTLYRLFYKQNPSCYEFETRIGYSQYQNYPVGSIKEFTPIHKANVQVILDKIIKEVTLPGGETNLFP